MSRRREILLYVFFGGVAFVLNVGLFALFHGFMSIDALVSNVMCWVICVAMQFVTHKYFVFEAKSPSRREFFREVASFFGGRVLTLVVEELLLLIFITWLRLHSLTVKIVANVVVIVLNYIISKRIVFNGG